MTETFIGSVRISGYFQKVSHVVHPFYTVFVFYRPLFFSLVVQYFCLFAIWKTVLFQHCWQIFVASFFLCVMSCVWEITVYSVSLCSVPCSAFHIFFVIHIPGNWPSTTVGLVATWSAWLIQRNYKIASWTNHIQHMDLLVV